MTNASKEQRAWVLRLGHRLDDCLQENYVAVGWCWAKNALELKGWDAFKKVVQEHYKYPSNQALGNAAGSFWRFLHDMSPGDFVVVPVPHGFHVATVKTDAAFKENSRIGDANWQREVHWLTDYRNPIQRNFVANGLQRRLRARQTCVQADDFIDDIQASLTRTAPLNLAAAIRRDSMSAVADAVDQVLNDRDLERLVLALVQASGFDGVIPSRKQAAGDVDVRASKKLPGPAAVIGGDTTVVIGYQVKHHDDVTGIHGLEQVADAVESGEIEYGFLVTSAERFSEEVIAKVEKPLPDEGKLERDGEGQLNERYERVFLIDRKALAEWVLEIGLDRIDRCMTVAE